MLFERICGQRWNYGYNNVHFLYPIYLYTSYHIQNSDIMYTQVIIEIYIFCFIRNKNAKTFSPYKTEKK